MQYRVSLQGDSDILNCTVMQVPKGLPEEQAQKDREELIKPIVAWLINNDVPANTADNANKIYLSTHDGKKFDSSYAYPGDWVFLVSPGFAFVVDEGVFTSTYEVR